MTNPGPAEGFGVKLITVGERLQARFSNTKLYALGEWMMAGSPSAAYLQASWHQTKQSAAALSWLEAPGNQWALPVIPRLWQQATLLKVLKTEVEERLSNSPTLRQASAFSTGDVVHAGSLPEQPEEFFQPHPRESDHYAIALRLGRGLLRANLGTLSADGQTFEPFESTTVDNPKSPTASFATDFPGVRFT